MKRVSVPITAIYLTLSVAVCVAALEIDTTFVIVSSKGNYWKDATFSEGGSATVTVNAGQTHQIWRGFAGTFNEAGWDALKVLSQDKRDEAINLLFDRKNGIGFQWGRIPIGASDYALSRYTLDDGQGDDLTMQRFSIQRDKDCLIKFIKAAQAVKSDIKFWASPWTPPSWMKKANTAFDNAGFDGGEMRNEANVFKAHALYFSKFIEAYTAEGIPISAVCPQNEPGYTRSYPTCGWGPYNYDDGKNTSGDKTGTEYLSTFVADHLYPKLQADHPETEIWFGTLSNDNSAPSYWNGMKQKAGNNVKTMIKGLGLQWNNWSRVSENATAGYFVFCSEHQCGNYYWKDKVTTVEQADSIHFLPTMAPNNFSYGVESWGLIKKWVNAGAHLYSAWNMVLDTKGINLNTALEWPQNALLVVDRSAKTLTATPYYYVMRHIGQYVDSGAVRIGTQGGDALAFKNPNGAFVTIVYNSGGSKQMTVAVGGKNIQFTHPGQGWATVYTGPITSAKKDISYNQIPGNRSGLTITTKGDQYRIALPSLNAGHIELLTLTGRVLESRAIPQGSREILLGKQATPTGLLLVRVVYGGEAKTARLINY
ncbi:MAG: hypothetical protein JW913_03565 [Chitinispirillaceae bacterium]|nr:hypothetical protein [Chitinispirillaceae bacterium]